MKNFVIVTVKGEAFVVQAKSFMDAVESVFFLCPEAKIKFVAIGIPTLIQTQTN